MDRILNDRLTAEEGYRNIFEAASDGLVIYDVNTQRVVDANPVACEMHGYDRQEFIGLSPAVFMLPESYTLFMKHIQSVDSGDVFDALVVHLRKDGSPFHVEVRRSALFYQGRPSLLCIIRDVNQRIEAEKILNKQIEARIREQATLLAISHTLASNLEFQPGLILGQLREIIEFTHGGLFSLEGSTLVTLSMRGTPELEQSPPFHIDLHNPEILVALFNGHRPIRIGDVWSDDAQAQFLRSLLGNDVSALLEGMQSWMWVPLAVRGRIIGGIGIAEKTKNYFTVHHADLALSVANQAAITMVNAELYEQAKILAVLEERQNLARNLHDAVNQSLFSAGLIAEVLPRLWERNQVEARRSLENLRRLIHGAQAEMRALLAELRPSTLTDSNFGDLLRLLGNAFTGRNNIPVTISANEDGSLPAETQVTLYRICQEVLNNIARHAQANRVEINLRRTPNPRGFELEICDDGCGFDPSVQPPAGHYGLSMMRERAEAVGATLMINSQPGKGTKVMVSWMEEEIS